jgi:hypothetical protein
VAFSITLLHSFSPHVHNFSNDKLTIHAAASSNEILELVSRIFTFDPGDEHLENYKDSKVLFNFHIYSVIWEFTQIKQDDKRKGLSFYVSQKTPIYFTEWAIADNGTRGSPLSL